MELGIHIVPISFICYIESMKVTSKSMYTLHFLCALAIKSKEWPLKPVHLREIAKDYNIPFKFLEQIAILMKSVGLVKGARGKLGGYQLTEPAENISLSRIVKATEGEFFPCADIEGGNEVVTSLLHKIFQEGRDLVDRKLESITLAQIAEKAKQQLEPVPMYYL
jgi:Rrf2 family protein